MGTLNRTPSVPGGVVSPLSRREYVAALMMAAMLPSQELAAVLSAEGVRAGPGPRVGRWAAGLAGLALTMADALLARCTAAGQVVAGDEQVSYDPPGRTAAEAEDDSQVELLDEEGLDALERALEQEGPRLPDGKGGGR